MYIRSQEDYEDNIHVAKRTFKIHYISAFSTRKHIHVHAKY